MKKIIALMVLLSFSVICLPAFAQEGGPSHEAGMMKMHQGMKCPHCKGGEDKGLRKGRGKGFYASPEQVVAYDDETEAMWREMQNYKIRRGAADYFAIGAAIAIGIAVLGGALGQGKVAAAAMEGIARNPEASGKIFTPLIISLALIESLVIYALVIAFLLQGKL